MIHAIIETSHGTTEVAGTYLPAERDTGTPASFEVESAVVGGVEIELTDSELEKAVAALFDARADLLAAGEEQ